MTTKRYLDYHEYQELNSWLDGDGILSEELYQDIIADKIQALFYFDDNNQKTYTNLISGSILRRKQFLTDIVKIIIRMKIKDDVKISRMIDTVLNYGADINEPMKCNIQISKEKLEQINNNSIIDLSDLISKRNDKNYAVIIEVSPLDIAVRAGHYDLSKFLLERGADPEQELIKTMIKKMG